ncbi:hypothetical protein [Streptomyces sp. NBC_01506]|uniref:hypothetical protein n=1 Tax=Streptomyces sp. NBC_01506 TaxID=2903887 RepID=UPI0038703C5D
MKRHLLAPADKTAPPGSEPATAAAASAASVASAASAYDRLLCDLMMSFGPLGVPFPLLQTWRDRGGS